MYQRTEANQPTAYDRIQHSREHGTIYDVEYADIVEARLVYAPHHFVPESEFGLEFGAPAIQRVRVTHNSDTDEVVSVSISWFDGAIAERCPDLLKTERIREGTVAYIERMLGKRVTSGVDLVSVDRARGKEPELLRVEPGDPIRRVRTTLSAADGTVIEFSESISRQGRWSKYTYQF